MIPTSKAFLPILLILTAISAGCISEAADCDNCQSGIVTKIIDGDTLDINGERIRLSLVDAPELDADGGPASAAWLAGLCPVGLPAAFDEDDEQPKDRYGRTVAVVYCGDTNVNELMITSGHATVYDYYCSRSEFGDDDWAREAGCE